MNKIACIFILAISINSSPLIAQYYLRGQVKDDKGKVMVGAKLLLYSKGNALFYTDDNGSFGLPTSYATDTLTVIMDGYENFKKAVPATQFNNISLKMLATTAKLMRNRLSSVTKDLSQAEQLRNNYLLGESYSNLVENDFISAKANPETGFALNIDRASYSNIRRFINYESTVPTDAVRIEEMLNYFNFSNKKTVVSENEFSCATNVTTAPWNASNYLAYINLQAPRLNLDNVPPSNLVFLIDVSGSMDRPNRLPLLQSAFKLLSSNLREKDTITIVTYGGGVAIVLPPTSGKEKAVINEVIDSLSAIGDTPGAGAIRTAYSLAKQRFIQGGNNRVILATDGDFNVGEKTEQDLEDLIVLQQKTGIYLTCLGVGMGNYKDSKLETLAKKGNGNFAYIDNVYEAEKVLVTEFTKTLYTVANDAFINVKFNASLVNKYRLIGFDNKREAMQDTSSVIEGGEIGSGHNLMAIFEIEPTSNYVLQSNTTSEQLAQIFFQYKPNNADKISKLNYPIAALVQNFYEADSSYQFAAAIAMFGGLLKGSKNYKNNSFTEIVNIASRVVNPNNFAQQQFINLVKKAEKIYDPVRRKKGREK
jgi:Ca-activated chloride channel homolog